MNKAGWAGLEWPGLYSFSGSGEQGPSLVAWYLALEQLHSGIVAQGIKARQGAVAHVGPGLLRLHT